MVDNIKVPQQQNGDDCGVCCCMNVDFQSQQHIGNYLFKNLLLPYTSGDLVAFRFRILISLVSEQALSDAHEPPTALPRGFEVRTIETTEETSGSGSDLEITRTRTAGKKGRRR